MKGWEAGLTWVFVQSFVLMAGGFIAPIIRKITPRAALLGTLAGVSITFISMAPALQMFMTPVIGVDLLRDHPAELVRRREVRPVPAGLVAIAVGTLIAWGSTALGYNFGGMSERQAVKLVRQLRLPHSHSRLRPCLRRLPVSRQ